MAETVHTTTKTFTTLRGEHVLSIDAGSGSVTVETQHGTGNWIVLNTYAADTVEVINFGNARVYRFTVTGDATYALD